MMLLVVGIMICVRSVMAVGPTNGENVIYDHERLFIVSKAGFRQWRQDVEGVPRFTVALFTEGMSQKAIEAKLASGWALLTVTTDNWRYTYLDEYVEGTDDIEMIYKKHNIPANIPT